MGKNLFQRGYKATRAEVARQEKLREQRKGQLWRLFLKEGDEVRVRFLTEEPVNFYEHNLKVGNSFEGVICTRTDCEHCANGDNPQFKGAYLVWDYRTYENREGKKVKGTLRLYVAGTRIVSQLDRLHTKYGLTNRDYTITRVGKGTATTYTFDREDEDKLTKKEIAAMLPETLRELYDGTMESLYGIVEKALNATIDDDKRKSLNSAYDDEQDDYEDDYDEEYDEDEDDDDSVYVDDDDEDEDDYTPPRRESAKKPSLPSKKSTSRGSARKIFKNGRR